MTSSWVGWVSTAWGAIARLYAIRRALDYTHPADGDRMTSPEAFCASTRALRLANGAMP